MENNFHRIADFLYIANNNGDLNGKLENRCGVKQKGAKLSGDEFPASNACEVEQ